jgi:sterol desaturase/sphingolipid hydroxylase (fatty acid hydroxylase superfamily)
VTAPAPVAPFAIPDAVKIAVPLFVLMIVAEMLYVRFARKGRYQITDSAASLSMGFGNQVVGVLFGAAIQTGAYVWVYEHRLFTLQWTWPVMLVCFFGEDLAYYWFHRVAHERRFFWASHVVHHSSQHYNLTTALRQTWTGALGFNYIFWLPLLYLGFPPAMVAMFTGFSLVYQFWIHTELIDRMGPWEWLFNTPSHHRVHHAINANYLDANYAGVLIIWDRLFGTFIAEDRKEPPRYGIVSQLGTFNPLRVALHEWAGIARDVSRAKSGREVLGYVFGPPGWSPDGSRKTSASIKRAWAEQHAPAVAAE